MTAINLGSGLWVYISDVIDGTVAATTTLFTTRNDGERFYPLSIMNEVVSATLLTVGAGYSVGGNGGVNDTVASATSGTAVNSIVSNSGPLVSIAPGTDMKLKVSTGATATAAGLRVMVMGFYA